MSESLVETREDIRIDEWKSESDSDEETFLNEEIERLIKNTDKKDIKLNRDGHASLFYAALTQLLDDSYVFLDSQRSWILYQSLHGLDILGAPITDTLADRITSWVKTCWNDDGGIGGGPGQQSHMLTTYSMITALVVLGTEAAHHLLADKRDDVFDFLMSCKRKDGSFSVEAKTDERDLRAIYGAVAIGFLFDFPSQDLLKLFDKTSFFISSCQTYEGGFGALPGAEAHGGYTYCGLAALSILNALLLIDVESCLSWLTRRQSRVNYGFEGRTNKLVDVCYAFWQGASISILSSITLEKPLFDSIALQSYILHVSQTEEPGLRDKPGKSPDFYHTCYGLSGLSIAQHRYEWRIAEDSLLNWKNQFSCTSVFPSIGSLTTGQYDPFILGDVQENLIPPVHPFFNVLLERMDSLFKFFKKMDVNTDSPNTV